MSSSDAPVPRSIENQLLRSLVLGFLALGLLVGVGFYAYFRSMVTREFDEALVDRTRAIASMVEQETDGHYEFPGTALPEFQKGNNAQYFLIRYADQRVFARSPSLPRGVEIPVIATALLSRRPTPYNVTLPDGRAGRAAFLRFNPMIEKKSRHGIEERVNKQTPMMELIIARDRKPLDRSLAIFAIGLVGAGVFLASASAWLLQRQLRQSLQPLNDVARVASTMDASSLHQRFAVDSMPRELQPICQRLNDLLARIAQHVETQKRFTADAAHELRTPVAEVRALAEVALRWPGDAEATRKAFEEIVAVTLHMERLSSVLLQLSSGANRRISAREEPVDIVKSLRQAIERRKPEIERKRIDVKLQLPPVLSVTSDSTLLTAVIENLVDNAITYTPPGGHLACSVQNGDGAFEISNGPTDLTEVDLPSMTDPFWRKDSSRSGGKMGLGLALTRAYLSTLGGSLSLDLGEPAEFSAKVDLHKAKRVVANVPTGAALL